MKAAAQRIAAVDLTAWVQSLRPHQWCKNLLVFLPLVAAHRFNDATAWQKPFGLFAISRRAPL